MPYVFRTDGPWGAGKGSDLDPEEIDGNFWQAIQDIIAKALQGVGIADIIVVGNQMTFMLTDHTLLGPYTLPTASFGFRGTWGPSTSYYVNDIFDNGGSVYIVLTNHVSGATFDPNATDGGGHNLYGLLLTAPLQSWDFGFAFSAEPAANFIIQIVPVTRTITIPPDMAGSVGFCIAPPAADYVIELLVDETAAGTITVNPAGGFTFSTSGVTVPVTAGQTITFKSPAGIESPPAGIGGVAVTVLANQFFS